MYQGFNHSKYLMQGDVFQFRGTSLGGICSIFDPYNSEVFHCEKDFSSNKDLYIYTNKNKLDKVLISKTRKIVHFSAAYDVLDPKTNEKIGAVKRKGLKSMIQEEWIIMDKYDKEVGSVKEDNALLAFLRRWPILHLFWSFWFPAKYFLFIGEKLVGTFQKNRNLFVQKFSLDFSSDVGNLLDKRIRIALIFLMMYTIG